MIRISAPFKVSTIFFGAVVVLTIIAAECFDPRLIWDYADPNPASGEYVDGSSAFETGETGEFETGKFETGGSGELEGSTA